MIDLGGLARSTMLGSLTPGQLELVAETAHERAFEPGEPLCRAGEPAKCCWVITAGLVDVLVPSAGETGDEIVRRHRKGATIGEVAAILGEPYAETVVASIPTTTIELAAAELSRLVEQIPQVLKEVLRSQQSSLSHAQARRAERNLGERVALVVGGSLRTVAAQVISAAQRASARPFRSLDREFSFAGAVTAADEMSLSHATVLLPTELDAATVATLMRETDRVVVLAGTGAELAELELLPEGIDTPVELVVVGEDTSRAGHRLRAPAEVRLVRACQAGGRLRFSDDELTWLGRHLTRTKLGLALGAGGAAGYAHIGVLQVLQDAGYVIDYVAGSSIGAIVGSFLALGADAAEIDRTLRETFDPPTVAEIFKPALSGRATGLELMRRLLREATADKTFADTQIPLCVMAVDLDQRAPAPLRDGPIWEALLASTALAGVFPPYLRDGRRLVDGLALVPVPTSAVVEDGADVTVAVNLISQQKLPAWPEGETPEAPPQRRRRGILDDLLEVMDLSQMSDSVYHARLADVPITPKFGPGEWRDFHLADLFLAAGRRAAQEQLPMLRSLVVPATPQPVNHEQGGGSARADPVRL